MESLKNTIRRRNEKEGRSAIFFFWPESRRKNRKNRGKVKKAEKELQEAVDSGKGAAKIAKKRNKLPEEQQKLRNPEAGL